MDELKETLLLGSFEYTLNLCKTKASYLAKPKKVNNFDLNRLKKLKEFEIIGFTKIVAVLKTELGEVIIHRHGELMFGIENKQFENNKDAFQKIKPVAEKIYSCLLD